MRMFLAFIVVAFGLVGGATLAEYVEVSFGVGTGMAWAGAILTVVVIFKLVDAILFN